VKLFVELYGAEAGNLALKSLALGGVYIGGGIGPKIRSIIESGLFMKGFIGKGRFKGLLEQVQVKLSLNPKTPLIGAMNYYR
jgi:glucokinase